MRECANTTTSRQHLVVAQVEGDVLVDGPRIKAARKTLRDQGYTENSHAMESATIAERKATTEVDFIFQ